MKFPRVKEAIRLMAEKRRARKAFRQNMPKRAEQIALNKRLKKAMASESAIYFSKALPEDAKAELALRRYRSKDIRQLRNMQRRGKLKYALTGVRK